MKASKSPASSSKRKSAGIMSSLKVIKRLLSFSGRSAWLFPAAFLFALFASVFSHLIPLQFSKAIELAPDAGSVDIAGIVKILSAVPIMIGISALSELILRFMAVRLGSSIIANIRKASFRKLNRLPLSYLDSHPSGDTLSRIIADADRMSDGLLTGMVSLYSSILGILVTIVFMFAVSPIVALAVILLTPMSMFFATFISGRTFSLFKKSAGLSAAATSLAEEYTRGFDEIKLFGREKICENGYNSAVEEYKKTATTAVFFSSLTNPVTRFVNSVIYAGVALVGGLLAISGRLGIAGFTVLLTYSREYAKPFNDLSGVIAEAQNALAGAVRIFELLDSDEIGTEPTGAPSVRDEDRAGTLEAVNAEFSYTDRPFIEDLSFSAPHGSVIALVGPTGCGKTTLVNLLMRFYDLKSGDFRLGSASIPESTVESVRESFGMVLQDTWLSSGSVYDNIRLGNPEATDKEIEDACRMSFADSFIRRLPDGYDTLLGDSEGLLSAGERQLLCIARLMVSPPPLLILDEATSSIDTRTEIKIQKAFAELMKGRTSIIVAHRLNTIKNADLIIVMKDGKIIESGRHGELMEKKGFYASLYGSQFLLAQKKD
ncbi:MAG: ABC transporter ATP-binding protein [Clostridia bacterium]|nr:ABC transporter ATP-binding protein [Clostridia bacterium]